MQTVGAGIQGTSNNDQTANLYSGNVTTKPKPHDQKTAADAEASLPGGGTPSPGGVSRHHQY